MKRITLFCAVFYCATFAFANAPLSPFPISHIATAEPGKDFDFSVLQLTSGALTLKVKLAQTEEAYFYIENKAGIPVRSQKIEMDSQEDILTIDISDLPNNSYRLTMASASKRISKTILIPK